MFFIFIFVILSQSELTPESKCLQCKASAQVLDLCIFSEKYSPADFIVVMILLADFSLDEFDFPN